MAFATAVVCGCGDDVPATPDASHDASIHHDGAADASDAGDVGAPCIDHDMTSPSCWTTFDVTLVDKNANGFAGATFDGRYIYFVPSSNPITPGVFARYDTTGTFDDSGSWSAFDVTKVDANAKAFGGAAFDGRYVYLVPFNNGAGFNRLVLRYDTTASFGTVASWSTFDITTLSVSPGLFVGAVFDGRYVYFVPNIEGMVARYDTTSSFTVSGSWSTFDTTTLNFYAKDFLGAIFDGRYVYLSPSGENLIARYDTSASFTAVGSWTTFDVSTINVAAQGFQGAAFDGRYAYLVPFDNGPGFDGVVARYDTSGGLTTPSSWTTFDTSTINPMAAGFGGAAFDGRGLYLVPNFAGGPDGLVARYDTTGNFAAVDWSFFDLTTINPNARLFWSSVFDGRYVYLAPSGTGVVARFDAKTAPSMPVLPAWHGSFF